jgi:hypothetical protein
MKRTTRSTILALAAICLVLQTGISYAVTLQYPGSQANLDAGLFPGGGLPYVTAYCRTSSSNNIYATDNSFPNQFYGRDGYALFATTFSYPNANAICCDPAIDPIEGDPLFPNIIDLPEWISGSQVLATRMAGGYGYALIDDPVLMNDGIRQWTFDGTNYPAAAPGNNTGQNPWVKIGFLDGSDIQGHNPTQEPTGRWGFTVGANVPSAFRIGVMTGGNDNANFAPQEVFIQQFNGLTPIGSPLGTGALTDTLKDRFFDMHFFDIIGAQEGDSFVIGAMAGPGEFSFGNSGIAGFSFDVLPDVQSADFNEDGAIDGRDFLAWQRGESPDSLSSGDLALWQDQYGPGSLANVSVPEPSSLLLTLVGLACFRRVKR